jgi:cystathionine beta-lyase
LIGKDRTTTPEKQMYFDFDRIIDRRNTASEKWDRYTGRDIIALWVADMDFASPPPVINALHRRIHHGVFGYTGVPMELIEAVVDHVRDEFDWTIDPEWLVWLPGLVCGLNVTCRSVGSPGQSVITAPPIYPPFFSAPSNFNRQVICAPLRLDGNRWTFDMDAFEAAVRPDTRLLLLCNPHNPVGRVFDRQELTAIADFCLRRNIIICADEIHNGLVLDRSIKHIPIATLDRSIAERTITLMAPSKTFNIPGLGCSFAIISNPEIRQNFKQAAAGIVPHVNALGLTAAIACYREAGAWRMALLEYLLKNRSLVETAITGMPGCRTFPVEATYLSWIDTRETGIENPAAFFEAAGVGLSDGKDFGAPGFVRLNFGCPSPLLVQGLERMRLALGSECEGRL